MDTDIDHDTALVERAIAALAPLDATCASAVRRARTLIIVVEEAGPVVLNYMNNACDDCPPTALAILQAANDWMRVTSLVAGEGREGWAAETARLLRMGCLVVAGTDAARRDETFEHEWEWDVRAGLFNLSIKDPPIMTTEEQVGDLEQRVDDRPRVGLYTTNAGMATVLELPAPDLSAGIFPALAARRTYREFMATPVPLVALADCLYAGLGITELIPAPIDGMGDLPFKMTPSGGARNPFEAYVRVGNVDGIAPGFYHYSAVDQTLGLVAAAPNPPASALLCGQDWWDGAGAVIFLVANFRRTMWKYEHPMAYRAVLIEAGHIGQNVMLAATHHGLCAGPTAFVRDAMLEEILQLDRVMQSVVYALAVGAPTPERRVNPLSAERRIERGAS